MGGVGEGTEGKPLAHGDAESKLLPAALPLPLPSVRRRQCRLCRCTEPVARALRVA